ncbi:MAG: Asp-tRNA(Asn)/Glu-tRNA(Gln) amidotransferase subunit GatA [Puniceicoccales bacterium]|jgi:aspartyl-tRNA(Asn)/glutamyl-tRNA(Gln) amidotransferase subunit A|nr:Asp-tRNA(Asn)/Glu-tRNA(Gln) amidotransferase subunit GatA [Puniceicoccales bacterium]
MPDSLSQKPATELAALLRNGQTSAREIAQSCIERVNAVDGTIGAFLGFDAGDFLKQADEADARRATGKTLGPLDGIPVALKDNISAKDQPLTCASKMLKGYVSPYDATVTRKLREAGALVWGRLNMDEFAMGASTENSAFLKTHNPRDVTRSPGGSSGGSAAAVAAGLTPLALGTDTGGSIRQPAAWCGVVGMKPTYGRVSRYGIAAFASSLDQAGPLARTVADAALLLHAISGADPRDGTALANPVPDYANGLAGHRGKPWRVGVPHEFFATGLDPAVAAAIETVIAFYRSLGCEIKQVSLPATAHAVAAYYIIATAEASSNLARYDGIRYGHRSAAASDAVDIYALSRAEGFGDEVKRRIILGTYVLTSGYYDAYYVRAQKVRTLIRDDFLRVFNDVDFLLTPVSPTLPLKLGGEADNVLAQYLGDIYTIPVNLAGLPAISVPCGSTRGLPAAFQLIGKPLDEATLLAAAHSFEEAHSCTAHDPADAK